MEQTQASEDKQSHDFSIPYSEEELAHLRKVFESLPTYRESDKSISTENFRELALNMRYERTEDQIQEYINYWNKTNGDRMDVDVFLQMAEMIHRTSVLTYFCAQRVDKDKIGFMTTEEFQDLLKVMAIHDPKLSGKTYEDFLAEGDTHKNGKVSLTECAAWIEGYCANSSVWELTKAPYTFQEDK